MKKHPRLMAVAAIVLIILIGVFVVVGIPLIRDTFTPPISGLPTTSAGSTSNSLQARYTQTALAKQNAVTASQTPPATP